MNSYKGKETRKRVTQMPKCTIKFSSQANKLVEELADRKNTTKDEIVRHALAMYKYLSDETSCGDKRVSITSAEYDRILKDIIM